MKLSDLQKFFPRGAQPSTVVVQDGMNYTVHATQVWETANGPLPMGLVWRGACACCRLEFYQLTPTHPKDLRALCDGCQYAANEHWRHDLHDYIKPRTAKWAEFLGSVKRRGKIETLVLEVVLAEGRNRVPAEEIVNRSIARIAPPEDGKRDTRRQIVVRALETLGKEKGGPVQITDGVVFVCPDFELESAAGEDLV